MYLIRITSVFLFVFIFSGCFSEDKSLKVAVLPWIGYESIYQADEFGWLEKNIELVKGEIPSDTLSRIMNGEVDAAAMTMEDVILARTKGVELTIVAVLDISSGSDVILSKDLITDFAQLKGKRVGAESSALALLMLGKTLEKAGLDYNDIRLIDLPPPKQLEAWKKDRVDLVVTYEPYATKLLEDHANYLISSREFPDMIFDVLVVRTDRMDGRESSIKKLLKAHFKTLDYFHENYTDILYRIAAREGTSPNDVKRALGGVSLPSKSANRLFFYDNSALYKSAKALNKLMFNEGFILKKDSLQNFANPMYLKD